MMFKILPDKEAEKPKSFFDNLSSKNSFVLGLISGFLILSSVGFFVLLSVLASEKNNDQSADIQAGAVAGQQIDDQAPAALTTPQVSSVRPAAKTEHVRGDFNAQIKIIEYSDLQCPFCKQVHPILQKLLADYPGKVVWIYRHFPLTSIHPYAQKAAEASECASEQGKFWEYADRLFENQQLFSDGYFSEATDDLGLDQKKFTDCLASGKYAQKVRTDATEAVSAGIQGTPGIFVNDQFIRGALPYDNFKQVIDSLLN